MSDKREPMLSDAFLMGIEVPEQWEPPYTREQLMHLVNMRHDMTGPEVRDWYEDLIDKGVLSVVKETTRSLEAYRDWYDQTFYRTDCCNRTVDDEARFCPNCGGRIKQANH